MFLQDLVEDLYKFRDHFFENHPIEKAHEKHGMVRDKLEQTLLAMDQLSLDSCTDTTSKSCGDDSSIAGRSDLDTKAKVLYFRGRALNVTHDHCPESESVLSKAVKLEPSFVEAWNELGECYWKRAQVENAKNCFEGALNHVRKVNPQLVVLWAYGNNE